MDAFALPPLPPYRAFFAALLRGNAQLLLLQLTVVLAVRRLATLPVTYPMAVALYACVALPAVVLARSFFNPAVHAISSALTGIVFGFCGSLHAFAYIHLRHASSSASALAASPYPSFSSLFLCMTVVFSLAKRRPTVMTKASPIPNNRADDGHSRTRFISLLRSLVFCSIAARAGPLLASMCHPDASRFARDVLVLALVFLVANGILSAFAFVAPAAAAPFSSPFLAPTQAAFWAGQWNAPVADALRAGVYVPLRHAGVSTPIASLAAFAFSGLGHEVLLWYGTGAPHGRHFLFFVCASAGVWVEQTVLKKWRVSALGTRLFGWLFLMSLFSATFVPPLVDDSNFLLAIIREMAYVQTALLEAVGALLRVFTGNTI